MSFNTQHLHKELREAMDDLLVMIDIHDQQKDILQQFCQNTERNLIKEREKFQQFQERSKGSVLQARQTVGGAAKVKKMGTKHSSGRETHPVQ